MRRPFWIHGPNNVPIESEDLARWKEISPGGIVLCQPHFDAVVSLRAIIPDLVIVGRIFGGNGWNAWLPPYSDPAEMRAYGEYCGRVAETAGIDIVQWANEPTIEWGISPTPEGYTQLAEASRAWLEGFRRATTRVRAGTVPLAPGHREDDDGGWGYRGADILKAVWHEYDVLLLHNYWTCDPGSVGSEWWGRRWKRQIAAYGWTKPVIITEFNRDPACADRPLEAEVRQFVAQLPFNVIGAAWFIWDSADPAFSRMCMKRNSELVRVASDINRNGKGDGIVVPGVEKPRRVILDVPANIYAGEPFTVTVEFVGSKGEGVMTLFLRAPRGEDGYTLGNSADAVYFFRFSGDGRYTNTFIAPRWSVAGPVSVVLEGSGVEIGRGNPPSVEFDIRPEPVRVTYHPTPAPTADSPQAQGGEAGEGDYPAWLHELYWHANQIELLGERITAAGDAEHGVMVSQWGANLVRKVDDLKRQWGSDPKEGNPHHSGAGDPDALDPHMPFEVALEKYPAPRFPEKSSWLDRWILVWSWWPLALETAWKVGWAWQVRERVQFALILLAAVAAESGGRVDAIGDGGKSVGLFQLHEDGAGRGLSVEQRMDPDLQFELAGRRFKAPFERYVAAGYTGDELATAVAHDAQRPYGYVEGYERDRAAGRLGPSLHYGSSYRVLVSQAPFQI